MEDEKFTDTIIDQFESVAPNKSIYFVAVENPNLPLKYVKSKNENIVLDTIQSKRFIEIKSRLEFYDVVVLHNLISPYRRNIVEEASFSVRFHWMVWGHDYYNLFVGEKFYLSNQSIRFLKSKRNIYWYIGKFLNNYFPFFDFFLDEKSKSYLKKDINKLIKKIESFSTVVPNEVKIINNSLNKNLKYIPLKYGYLENLILTDQSLICMEDNFFIGNSATPSNNHFEVLDTLSKSEFHKKIYIPVSYGDKTYKNYLKDYISRNVNKDVIFLEDFLDIKRYNEILLTCGNVVMNHYRQQAMGNILIALYNGARVFLNRKNPIYDYLNELGIMFFDTESDLNQFDLLPPFVELAKINRPILKEIYSKENVIEETRHFVEHFLS
ncbi:4-alpha-L-fucosyltransferase glycosyl transferase group 56 [Algoriphagus hitonicola]|uniref:4-alpha-L-fucosyltransferase glycosyl transferase group 56 n=2 Tax=Algoriphagus hitonicola TaxID=435880 RepID=A0A1I2XSD5_9BACT|nr:4-alpha-L-fucosyltransferase glycosyl transferase group 56 [Algoriphagus hitonicola]